MKVGVLISGADTPAILGSIRAAEDAGFDTAWTTSGPTTPDPLAFFAAAAVQTSRINFGTAIVHTFPRHPISMAAAALAVDQLAPGRLKLGVGPSGPMVIGPTFGIPFERPHEHLREYVTALRALLGEGKVAQKGKRISANARFAGPTGVKVLASALRVNAFRLCGEVADGAISWLCPGPYLRDTALPALRAGADAFDRPTPALVGHIAVCFTEDCGVAREAVRKAFGFFPRVQTYQDMFVDAGLPEARDGAWSDAMRDAICLSGTEAEVRDGLTDFGAAGVTEAMVSLLSPPGNDPAADLRRLGAMNGQ